MSKKEKAEKYDTLLAEMWKYRLALSDLQNGKMRGPIKVTYREVGFDEAGHISVRLSYRANPLFMIEEWLSKDQRINVYVCDESDVDNLRGQHTAFERAMLKAVAELQVAYYPKAA
jgi:hypothetical protein